MPSKARGKHPLDCTRGAFGSSARTFLAHCLRSSASPSPPTRPLLVSRPLFEHARALPDGVATARPPQYLEATAAGHRADFERERDRSDALMSETLKLTGIAMSAREKAARLEGEL